MAQDHDSDSPKRKRRGASVMAWVLLGMLVAGLGGFGVTNYGTGVGTIGSVGDREIDVNDYARALQSEINAFGAQVGSQIGLQEALALGLDARVRQQLVTGAALDNESDGIPLSVGDARVAQEITTMPAFKGASGSFDRETYRFALERSNLSEAKFEASLRDDLSRALLQGAIAGGFVAPAALTDTIHAHIAEKRGLTVLRLTEADLPQPLAAPTDEDLQAHYDANLAAFTRPEAKRIRYAALLPEALAATLPVDEAGLRALYDQRIEDFVKPERRLVERLVFGSDEEAAAAKARIDAGETFEAIVAERGLQLDDIDMGDVAAADLGAAGEAVFALAEPGVLGPLPSDLGPALFRVNAILAAQETSFEEAKADLTVEYQQDAARRAIADKVEAVDDALAGGATLDDLGKDFAMELGSIDFSSQSNEGMAGYPAFREAAEKLAEGDFPEAVLLDDGGLIALEFVETVAATPIPLEEAREAVTEGWRKSALAGALAERAAVIKAEVEGGADLAAYGILSVTSGITRDGFVEQTPADFLTTVFAMTEGEVRVIEAPEMVGLVRLDAITPAPAEGEDATALKGAIAAQVEQALAQDAFSLFAASVGQAAGLSLDQTAIDAVHAQFR